MTIESINSTQPIVKSTVKETAPVEEKKEVQVSKGNTKDVIAVLSALAALGAAGVAIFKHKKTNEALKKAEDAAKKLAEAEEKAKKAAEEVDKKVAEAVEKVKKELL